jgi:hypothetical protein
VVARSLKERSPTARFIACWFHPAGPLSLIHILVKILAQTLVYWLACYDCSLVDCCLWSYSFACLLDFSLLVLELVLLVTAGL